MQVIRSVTLLRTEPKQSRDAAAPVPVFRHPWTIPPFPAPSSSPARPSAGDRGPRVRSHRLLQRPAAPGRRRLSPGLSPGAPLPGSILLGTSPERQPARRALALSAHGSMLEIARKNQGSKSGPGRQRAGPMKAPKRSGGCELSRDSPVLSSAAPDFSLSAIRIPLAESEEPDRTAAARQAGRTPRASHPADFRLYSPSLQ